MKKLTVSKNQMQLIFKKIIASAQRMSALPYIDKTGDKKERLFIEDEALQYIMKKHTDRLFKTKK